VLFIVVSTVFVVVANVLTFVTAKSEFDEQSITLYYALVAAVLAAHYVLLRWIDGARPWSFVGLGRDAIRPSVIVVGLLLGAVAIGFPSVLLLLSHELRIIPAAPGSWWISAGRMTLMLLPAALFEELFVRGYIFATLRDTFGWKAALVVTSCVFGLLHLRNPGAGPESTLVVIIAGFFLGMILLVTNSLYAAWMAHFAWNWVMAALMHTAVSGLGLTTPNYQIVDAGPDWLTGGAWGPEGGLAAGVSMLGFLFYLVGRYFNTSASTPSARTP